MSDYDFTSLSSYDFELLVRDLLQRKLRKRFQSFKTGRDAGIDLRYSAAVKNKTIVVQCKHYANSKLSNLKSNIVNDELGKIKNLNPKRYILVTSLGLTPSNKSDLLELLKPYCKSDQDIFGKEDINNLIGNHPDVERKHFKLWLTSISVLERVLHCEVFNRTETDRERIQRKLRYYVQNQSFPYALKKLDDLHLCIISGNPGIGKTTLAEILLIYFLRRDYEIYSIGANISEVLEVYKSETKQVFYYDDFLGQTSFGEKLNKNEESDLLRLIETIRKSSNHKLILTTREYILNQAKMKYEKLDNAELEIYKCVVSLEHYTKAVRAQILYNHLYFSLLSIEYKTELLKESRYWNIINHRNYNPRIVEWMTASTSILNLGDKKYYAEFISNLDNPSRIWAHAFTNQLSNAARHLLITLFSLPNEVLLDDLSIAFDNYYYNIAAKRNYVTSLTDFKSALKELDGNFIHSYKLSVDIVIRFQNPSVKDFLHSFLCENPKELSGIVDNSVFFVQLSGIYENDKSNNGRFILKEAIKKQNMRYFLRLRELFNSTECSLRRYSNFDKGVYVSRNNKSLDDRVRFICSVAKEAFTGDCEQDLTLILKEYLGKTQTAYPHFWVLSVIAETLISDKSIVKLSRDAFIEQIKNMFISKMGSLEDYDSLTRVLEIDPGFLADEEKALISHALEEKEDEYEEEISNEENVAVLELAKDQVSRIKDYFGLPMSTLIDTLNRRIVQLYSTEKDEDAIEDVDELFGETKSEKDERQRIDNMFSGLI